MKKTKKPDPVVAAAMRPFAVKVKKEELSKTCHHDALNFSEGGLYLTCEQCDQKWMAVDKNNTPQYGLTPVAHLNVFTQRWDPFSI